ncbi:MAG: hypothetical protein KJ732_03655 [Candidatus Margulisbacteria bacterium]|nr:hypothetical protein [Candidatus Margulisiibacteriota bacterium]
MVARTNMRTMTGYRGRVLSRTQAELNSFYGSRMPSLTTKQIALDQVRLRAYRDLGNCDMQRVADHLVVVTPDSVSAEELRAAEAVKLGGQEIVEDAAAGEATRLGLGTKYLLTPQKIAEALILHGLRQPDNIIPIPVAPNDLAPISLGVRHKLQFVYDLIKLAASPSSSPALNPAEVIKSQFSLTVLNEETQLQIVREFAQHSHFGLSPERTLFVVQEKGLGMSIRDSQVYFDQRSEFRLWNHGDMKTQETLNGKVFWARINPANGELERNFLAPEAVEEIFSGMSNLTSYPIEDLDYLTSAINLTNLAMALRLGNQGFRMTMEAVAQGIPPQKGGFFTFDPALDKVVCIESDCGGDIVRNDDPASLAQIAYLNKNFNMFPNPVEALRVLARQTLPQHLTIKGHHLYPQSVQGDQNFELPTAVIMWQPVQQIRNLKILAHGAPTLEAMQAQDQQPGFLDLAREHGII